MARKQTTTSSRFKILDAPYATPGKCAVCGYAASGNETEPDDKRQYIDFGLDIDYYGVVYICTTCIHELTHQLGYILPVEADEFENKIEELTSRITRLEVVTDVINSMADVLIMHGWVSSVGSDFSVEGESTFKEAAPDGSTNNSESEQPIVESRSNDVRDTSDLHI